MTDLLEHRLAQLAERLDVSVDDRLVTDVLAALARPAPVGRVHRGSLARSSGRRVIWPAIAAAALVVAVVVAIPGTRHAVARWLGIGNTRFEYVPLGADTSATFPPPRTSEPPTASVIPTVATSPGSQPTATVDATSIGRVLGIGEPTSASDASTRTGLPVPVAPGLGPPLGVYVTTPPSSGQVIVAYPAGPLLPATPVAGVGALLATSPGSIDDGSFVKMLGPDVTVDAVRVTTASREIVGGFWLAGSPHGYGFVDADGRFELDSLRLATNTLLWVVDGVQYRLESGLTRDGALAVAATVVPSS
jgi:hypothetical protein